MIRHVYRVVAQLHSKDGTRIIQNAFLVDEAFDFQYLDVEAERLAIRVFHRLFKAHAFLWSSHYKVLLQQLTEGLFDLNLGFQLLSLALVISMIALLYLVFGKR